MVKHQADSNIISKDSYIVPECKASPYEITADRGTGSYN